MWWIWQTRHFDGLATRDLGFDVIFPGWFSTAAGPDFREAMIAAGGGAAQTGDVELHVVDSAWRQHGHDRDPSYETVMLHVVLERDSGLPTVTASGREVPVLELAPLLTSPLAELAPAALGWQPSALRCPAHQTDPGRLLREIEQAGRSRFRAKAERLSGDVAALGADEALYRTLADCLGYSANRQPFRKLAEALPFQLLSSLTVLEIERLLLSAAGLTPDTGLLGVYIDGPVLRPGELTTFRIRPANSPAARLRGLARLIATHRDGLAQAIAGTAPEALWRLFAVECESVLVGKGRARDMAVNVALPYLATFHGLDGEAALRDLGAPDANRWVASLRARLRASGLTIQRFRALHHLGLQELSLRFCRYDHCEACPLHRGSDGA